jgi:hypothetical protein
MRGGMMSATARCRSLPKAWFPLLADHNSDSSQSVGVSLLIKLADHACPSRGIALFGSVESGVEFVDAFAAVRNEHYK